MPPPASEPPRPSSSALAELLRRGARGRTAGEGMRFLVAGAANALATYLLYLALLGAALTYALAYSIAYAAGILFAFVVNSRYVFREPLSWRRLVPYPSIYLVQYWVGLGVLAIGVDWLGVSPRLMPLVALLVTTPLSFAMNRLLLARRR